VMGLPMSRLPLSDSSRAPAGCASAAPMSATVLLERVSGLRTWTRWKSFTATGYGRPPGPANAEV
jgi:hypothetical protein